MFDVRKSSEQLSVSMLTTVLYRQCYERQGDDDHHHQTVEKKNERTGVAEIIKMLKLTLTAKKMFKC